MTVRSNPIHAPLVVETNESHAHPDSPASMVSTLLASAASAALPERTIAAAALLDPERVAQWMLDDEQQIRCSLAPASLSRALDAVVAALPESLPGHSHAVTLGDRYEDVIGADAVASLAVRCRDQASRTRLAHRALQRFPNQPDLLRIAAENALGVGDSVRAEALLDALGRADSSPATVRYVLRQRARITAPRGRPVRIALLSTHTVDPLLPHLDLECRHLGLAPQLYVAPFNAWEQEVVADGSGLYQMDPEIVFLALALDDLVTGIDGDLRPAEFREATAEAVRRILAAVARLAGRGTVTVVHALYSGFSDPSGPMWSRERDSRSAIIADCNRELSIGLDALPSAYLLDVKEWLLRRSDGALESPKLRHLARIRWSDDATVQVARAYTHYLAPLKGLTRKCVVVDLDNTLWGGVVGEDGVHGIRLGTTSPGSEFVEFQRFLRLLRRRGILLAVASKNNPDDALAAIRGHGAMVLREDDFAALKIGWDPKPESVRAIARELGIGQDSIVFLDDNPNERALMRQMLPEVLTPELPADPSRYRETVEVLPQLQVLVVTDEDRARAEMYRERAQREQARLSSGSLEDFLHTLDIEAHVSRVSGDTLQRVHQLFQRTNQFNLTTLRPSLEELARRIDDPAFCLLAVQVRDRYGEHGLVGVALARAAPAAWTVEAMLLSCRVIGYGVETALLAAVARRATAAGVETLEGLFRPSSKNTPASDFYPRHGFSVMAEEGSGSRWMLDLARAPVSAPTWIKVTDDET